MIAKSLLVFPFKNMTWHVHQKLVNSELSLSCLVREGIWVRSDQICRHSVDTLCNLCVHTYYLLLPSWPVFSLAVYQDRSFPPQNEKTEQSAAFNKWGYFVISGLMSVKICLKKSIFRIPLTWHGPSWKRLELIFVYATVDHFQHTYNIIALGL